MSRAQLLGQYLAECGGRRFDWRNWNCCHFAAGWVRRVTGIDAMAGLPATPSRHAAARVRRSIGATLADAVDARLGFEPAPQPHEGDLVLVADSAFTGMGVCGGPVVAMLTPDRGLCFVPMACVQRAWRVPA